MMYIMCFILFFFSIMMIACQSGHFFMVLLSLEVMTLSLFFLSVLSFFSFGGSVVLVFGLGFLTFSVCEASLGLGLLVSSMREQGFDFIKSSLALKF